MVEGINELVALNLQPLSFVVVMVYSRKALGDGPQPAALATAATGT
jgi:hypothetical protein